MRPILIAALWSLLSPLSAGAAPLRVTAPATAVRPGSVLLLTIRSDDAIATLRVHAFGHELAPFQVDATTWQVLAVGALAVKPGGPAVEIDGGPDTRPTHTLPLKPPPTPPRLPRL